MMQPKGLCKGKKKSKIRLAGGSSSYIVKSSQNSPLIELIFLGQYTVCILVRIYSVCYYKLLVIML